jgi:hypothetical protein
MRKLHFFGGREGLPSEPAMAMGKIAFNALK